MARTVSTHYLRANHREDSPHRLLVIDTETTPIADGDEAIQALALWAARLTIRHGRARNEPEQQDYFASNAETLATLIDRLARKRETLWVFAHNLSFDLTVTRLPILLTERGWTLTNHALTSDSPWAQMANGRHHLTLANSASYLPASVLDLGRSMGIEKPPLPAADDTAALLERCKVDVAITSQALIEFMDWWDAGVYGHWSITGPATGWGAYRHRHMMVKVLIDLEPDAVRFERKAITSGRREAWRIGEQRAGPYLDLDIEHAHLTAAAHMPLPYRRCASFDSLPLDHPTLHMQGVSLLAEVEIETDTPRYPLRMPHGIFYPRGRFRTVLAGPEIREALQRDELRAIGHGYKYLMGAHMASWGHWLIDLLSGRTQGVPPVVMYALKGWSRSVPGRWAGHSSEVIEEYIDTRHGWHLEHGTWGAEQVPVSYLTYCGTQYVIRHDLDSDNAFPAVLAWIQSYTRIWLGRAIDILDRSVVQCNTDGVIADARATTRHIHRINAAIAPARIRIKRTSSTVNVLGAQHVILDDDQRLAGIPREAVSLGDLRFRWWSWPSLPAQMARERPQGFAQRLTTSDLSKIPINRWVLADGQTRPVTAEILVNGQQSIVPFAPGIDAAIPLADDRPQHPDLCH